jgi:hypothetical protein
MLYDIANIFYIDSRDFTESPHLLGIQVWMAEKPSASIFTESTFLVTQLRKRQLMQSKHLPEVVVRYDLTV